MESKVLPKIIWAPPTKNLDNDRNDGIDSAMPTFLLEAFAGFKTVEASASVAAFCALENQNIAARGQERINACFTVAKRYSEVVMQCI
jgi:hypothetical protein